MEAWVIPAVDVIALHLVRSMLYSSDALFGVDKKFNLKHNPVHKKYHKSMITHAGIDN